MAVKALTEIGVAKLKASPDGKRQEIWDSIVQNLCLRVSAKGVKSWYFIYRMNGGKQHRMLLGHHPTLSLKQAREISRDAKFEISQGNDPLELREQKERERERAKHEAVTVAELAQQCLERHWKPNIRRWKTMEEVFKNHINPVLGDMPAKDVAKKDVHRLLDKLKSSKHPHTATHSLAALRKMFNWAIERDILEYNPCHTIKKPVASKSRERYLSDAEIKEFWDVCETVGYPYGPIAQLLLLTGQRVSEISKLKFSELDYNNKLIRLSGEKVKNKRNHEVPLSGTALAILESLPRHKGAYIFTTTGGKKAVDNFSGAKKSFEQHFTAEDWRFHDLRRTCATGMAMLGVTREQIKRVLNHSDGSVTAIYDRHTYLPETRKALDIWAAHVEGIVSGNKGDNVVHIGKRT